MESKVSEKDMREVYFQAFGKEYDSADRKQAPLPLDIAYLVALNKLKREGKYEGGGEITDDTYYQSVNDFVFFCMNYPANFLFAFGSLKNHLANKFKTYYNSYGSFGVMIKFYTELDSKNRRILTDFAYENYDGTYINSDISEVEYFNSVNHFIFFCFNFPNNFMEAFPSNLRVHLSEKWSYAYNKKGSVGAMIYFWSELSDDNRKRLANWSKENYTGTRLYEAGGLLGEVAGMLPSPLPMSTIQPMAKGGMLENAQTSFSIHNDYYGNLELGFYNIEFKNEKGTSISNKSFYKLDDAFETLFEYLKSENGQYIIKKEPKSNFYIEERSYDGKSTDSDGYPDTKYKTIFKISSKKINELTESNNFEKGGQLELFSNGGEIIDFNNLENIKKGDFIAELDSNYNVLRLLKVLKVRNKELVFQYLNEETILPHSYSIGDLDGSYSFRTLTETEKFNVLGEPKTLGLNEMIEKLYTVYSKSSNFENKEPIRVLYTYIEKFDLPIIKRYQILKNNEVVYDTLEDDFMKTPYGKKNYNYSDGGGVNEIKKINKEDIDLNLSIEETKKIAKELAGVLGSKYSVTENSIEEASFDLDFEDIKYDGGSYLVLKDGSIVNVAVPNKPVYYNYKNKTKYKTDYNYADGGGVGKKSDRNETQENNFGVSYKLGDKFILGKKFGNNKDVEVSITEIMPSGLFFKVDKSGKTFSIKTLHSKGSTYTSGEYLIPIKKDYADGGGVEPNIYFYNDGEQDITFTTFEQAYNEVQRLGYSKFRDNLGGEYFVNKDLTKKTIYQHKSNPYITLEFLEDTNKGVKGLQKNPKSLSKKERKDGIIVYYSDSEMKELFDKKYADGGGVDDCIEYIKNSESIKDNGYYLHIDNMYNYVGSNSLNIPKINSLCLITFNSGGQKNLKAVDTINSILLSSEIAKLLNIDIEIARIIVSEQITFSKQFTMNMLDDIENKNIIIADRDTIVCTNLSMQSNDSEYKSAFNSKRDFLKGKTELERIEDLKKEVSKNKWSREALTEESGIVKVYSRMYDLDKETVVSIFNEYQKKYADGGDMDDISLAKSNAIDTIDFEYYAKEYAGDSWDKMSDSEKAELIRDIRDNWFNDYEYADGGETEFPIYTYGKIDGKPFEVIGVNYKTGIVRVKNFSEYGIKEMTISEWIPLTYELGTPASFIENGREVSGEVVMRDGKRAISLYKDDNYGGGSERIRFFNQIDLTTLKSFMDRETFSLGGFLFGAGVGALGYKLYLESKTKKGKEKFKRTYNKIKKKVGL